MPSLESGLSVANTQAFFSTHSMARRSILATRIVVRVAATPAPVTCVHAERTRATSRRMVMERNVQ